MKIHIGPSICQDHFEAHMDVADEILKSVDHFSADMTKPHVDKAKVYVDLKKVSVAQLLNLKLRESLIQVSEECTFCLPEKYASFRREKVKGPSNEAVIYKKL